jgi:hypothetical protein
LKNYIDLTHQKFKVLRFQKVDRFLNFLHIQIYALRWWLLYELKCMMSSEESLTISCLLHDVKNGDLNSNVTIKVHVARYVI